jgi:hypothetical protein
MPSAGSSAIPAWGKFNPRQRLESVALISYQFQLNYPPLQLLIQGKRGNGKKTGE